MTPLIFTLMDALLRPFCPCRLLQYFGWDMYTHTHTHKNIISKSVLLNKRKKVAEARHEPKRDTNKATEQRNRSVACTDPAKQAAVANPPPRMSLGVERGGDGVPCVIEKSAVRAEACISHALSLSLALALSRALSLSLASLSLSLSLSLSFSLSLSLPLCLSLSLFRGTNSSTLARASCRV